LKKQINKKTSYAGDKTLYETIIDYHHALNSNDVKTAASLLDTIFTSSTMLQRSQRVATKIMSVYGEFKLFGDELTRLSLSDLEKELLIVLKRKVLTLKPKILECNCDTHARYLSHFWAIVSLKEKEATSDFLLSVAQKNYPTITCNYLRTCLGLYAHNIDIVEMPLDDILLKLEKTPIKANGGIVGVRTVKNLKILLGQESKDSLYPDKQIVRSPKFDDGLGRQFFTKKEMCEYHKVPISWYNNKIQQGVPPAEALKSYYSTPKHGADRKLNIKPVDYEGNTYPNISKMCDAYEVPVSTFYSRMHRGYSLKDALCKK